jgi:hypothetical protein
MTAHNAFLDQFLKFYSQSEAGNGLTRGLDSELARLTYVPTKLDRELAQAILNRQYRLVILTGNAGDGKTAFIQQVEEAAAQRGASLRPRDSLGTQFVLDGWSFKTLYDGSVDAGATSNREMLTGFFGDLAGDRPPTASVCLVVAMNEGKLRDFLSHTEAFPWLSRTVLGHIQKDGPLPDDIVVVNLNLRSVVDASSAGSTCLFDQILERYVAEEFWSGCRACSCGHRCPVKFNVDTVKVVSEEGLEDKDMKAAQVRNHAARMARARLKAVFQVLHVRKRIHVTVRDLRSVLAFALLGKSTCEQVEREVQAGETDFTDRYYYNAIFSEKEKDRILVLLREFDVGLACTPHTDSTLSFTRPKTPDFRRLFYDFEDHRHPDTGRSRVDEDDLLRLYDARPRSPEERTPEALEQSRKYVLALRRKLFFEGNRADQAGGEKNLLSELLPYDNLGDFLRFVEMGTDAGDELKSAIVLAISKSESIYDEQRGQENICIRTRHDPNTKVKAFFTYPASDFELSLPNPGPHARFIEFLPTSIILRHRVRNIALEISLDLYEMLMRIRDGYVPAASEMRAFFLNLLMFKKQLMATPSDHLILTETDYQHFQLSKTPDNGVSLTAL